MKDERKTKAQLIQDLADLRRQVSGLKRRRGRTADTEEGLKETLDDESLVLGSISEEVVYHDRNMAIIWANRAAAESAGLTPEQLVGRMCYEVWHGREQVCDGCPVHEAMDTGAPAESEITTPDGREWHVHGYPVCEDGGQIVGAVEIVRDVTQRRQAERVLRESEEKYRLLFEQSPIGIGLASLDGQVLAGNKAMEAITGYSPEDLSKIDLAGTYQNPQDREALMQAVQQYGSVTNYGVGLKRRDGTPYTALLTVSRVRIGGQDLLQTVCIDVSHRKQAEEALRESEARYRAVVEDQTELICRFVPDGTLTFVNEAYCRYFGSTREEMTGINFLPLIPDEDRGAVVEHFASITSDSPSAEHEHRTVLPSGEVRWLYWTNRGIFDETGRLVEVQAVGRDVTDR
ncbi:MAG TPA: PAS domain-containing protein, partial [Phycisphaerae bacterium]|nr:PAS domain-containing protein [Phycisphaerae bacterium]